MKKAYNQKGNLVNIINSVKSDTYICPVCKETLNRKFGVKKQYFAHPKEKGKECELKMIALEKVEEERYEQKLSNILKKEFYEKKFDNVSVELSNYKSEEGYFLTLEQKNIIFSKEDKIKINALAGSSKSTTLYYYAKERFAKKILYLVYNKSMQIEAEKLFNKLSHVDIKTIHGLAFGYIGKFYKHKLSNDYKIADVINDLGLIWGKDTELAVKIHTILKEYMLSEKENILDIDLFTDDLKERETIINYAKKLWEFKKDTKNNIKIEHDFYLKLFHLSKIDLSKKYDIIMVDECQDASMMILDILKNSIVKGVVIVGDFYQQIYGFRKAINIMPHFDAKEYRLTTSFRVSQNIANVANLIVKDVTGDNILMKGFNNKQKIVDKINRCKKHACLCRTNSYIFAEVFDVVSNNKKSRLFFEGGYNSYNFENIRDAYRFYIGYKVNNSLFNKFQDYSHMIEFAEKTEDLELLALDKMIYRYGDKIPRIIDSIKYNTVNNKNDADVIFTTVHRSKGMTYHIPIYISNDHFDIEYAYRKQFIDKTEDFDIKDFYDEMCILYVAITRCAGEIELSDKLKRYLLLRWENDSVIM